MTHAILHRIEMEASPEALRNALTTRKGLAAWWTPHVRIDGARLAFRFGNGKHGPDMVAEETEGGVVWRCVAGPWVGHRLVFAIDGHERGSLLRFRHEGWKTQDDFFAHCNGKWAFFLAVSLKGLLETGVGRPHPDDPKM